MNLALSLGRKAMLVLLLVGGVAAGISCITESLSTGCTLYAADQTFPPPPPPPKRC